MSLSGPGAELEGGVKAPPPSTTRKTQANSTVRVRWLECDETHLPTGSVILEIPTYQYLKVTYGRSGQADQFENVPPIEELAQP